MCTPASFVLTKDRVFWSKKSDSHEDIIEEYKLNPDGIRGPNIVRVKISPTVQHTTTSTVSILTGLKTTHISTSSVHTNFINSPSSNTGNIQKRWMLRSQHPPLSRYTVCALLSAPHMAASFSSSIFSETG